MPPQLYPIFETVFPDAAGAHTAGFALGRAAEAHPDLAPLLDFCAVDPREVAVAVGMVYPYEEGGLDDLDDLDFGPPEWYEPSAALPVLRRAAAALRARPESLAAAIYDPSLRPADVLMDLDALVDLLEAARQHETRFHLRQVG